MSSCARTTWGRIAWQAANGPQILPITYTWHDDGLVFRTSPYGVLSELVRPKAVVSRARAVGAIAAAPSP